ncbi:MAG: DUF1549 domain-containing protein [Planctomycetota bacterium]
MAFSLGVIMKQIKQSKTTLSRIFLCCCCALFSNGTLPAQEKSGSTDRTSEEMTARVDELLEAHLKEIGWDAAEPCNDSAFLRRVHLDLTGAPPTGSEVLAFAADESNMKDIRLVDRLLGSATSASHLAGQWSRWMLPEDNSNPFLVGNSGLRNWLRDRFAENLRYDRLVSDLMVATGPVQAGPSEFFVALEVKPEKIAAKTARVFMGVQLDCAECHDHPFDEWTQQDFWGFAAYFAQLSNNVDQPIAMRVGEIQDSDEGDVTLPGTEEIVPPKPLVETGFSGLSRGTRRQQLTLWLTAKENPFLARATVNRVWAMLFGRGLIEPIDDMRSIDMASHPEVLRELSEYFAASGYDLRNLISTLAKTKAYRRSSMHIAGEPPEASYAVMTTKPLTEQQINDTLTKVARQIVGNDNPAAQNVLARQLGQLRGDASEAKLGIVSALVTLHGDLFDQVSREDSSRLLKALEAPFLDQRKQLRWLFLSTLNRLPSQEEEAAFSELFSKLQTEQTEELEGESATEQPDPQIPWQSDLLWALLNSTEFAMTP